MTTTRTEDLSQSMTLRDTFAAAALAGLLVHANDDHDEDALDTPSDIAYTAYQMADAMLRERDAKNHDAAPAARASLPTADHAVCRGRESGCGTGDTPRVQPAIARLREWERHGSCRWGLGAAGDVTMLERRLAIVEAIVLDAAPAARAHVDAAGISRQGTGHTNREPLAWGVLPGGDLPLWRCRSREQAESVCAWLEQQRPGSEPQVVPLVDGRAAPTLTDAEREAIEWAAFEFDAVRPDNGKAAKRAATMRGLLERTK